MKILNKLLKTCFCLFIALGSFNNVQAKVDTIVVQLKWQHQFQFAGYYAAQQKAFYEDENLYVKFKESFKEVDFSKTVLNKDADFAITGSEIILDYVNSKSIVALASIFQHSPYVIISKKEKNITKPTDLAGKEVYAARGQGLFLLYSLLKNEGIPISSVKIFSPLRNPSLDEDYVDAITSYRSSKMVLQESLGYEVSKIDPADYGVDFYGDILVTSKENIEENPDKVQRFIEASLKGWKYALENPDEISNYILTLPGVKERGLDKEFLLKEAETLKTIIRPDLVEIGHMNKGRWEYILQIYEDLGFIKNARSINIDEFLYNPDKKHFKYINRLIAVSSILLLIAILFFLRNLLIKHNLRKAEKKVAEASIKEKLNANILNTILEYSGIILWNWNVAKGKFETYGGDGNNYFLNNEINSIDDFKALIHPKNLKSFDLFLNILPDNYEEEILLEINGFYEWYMLKVQVREKDNSGNPISYLGLLLDISNLKRKEENLDRLSLELKKTNSELQKFAYITSHNLRGPIVNLGSLLEFYDYNAQDLKGNNEVIDKIGVSVDKLKNTLDDLIVVVSKKTDNHDFDNIDIKFEIENILKDLNQSSIKIEYDFTQISHFVYPKKEFITIFSNLLLNCYKFRNPDIPLVVKINSFFVDEYIAIKITDNGIGIDLDKNRDKIFGLYQRFNLDIEGRGIGLFITKSQIENLNGKIEVESKLNLGATFTVFFRKRALK